LENRGEKFPTIGKTLQNFSNDWKNGREIFPMIGNFSKGWKTFFCVAAGCVLMGCAQQPAPLILPEPSSFSGERALQEVADLIEINPRDAGTPGAKRAADYLRDRMQALGVEARVDEFEDETPVGIRPFRNVIGRIPGTGDGMVIIGSHFDTKVDMAEGFTGANDSGSSSGILLEMARVLGTCTNLPIEVLLVHFDGEESLRSYSSIDGLHGSRHFVKQLQAEGRDDDVRAMILLDMAGDRDYTMTIPQNCSPELIKLVFEAARTEGVRNRFELLPYGMVDDHKPFFEAGIPAVNLIDFEFGSRADSNDYWHTEEDTLDKLSAESLGISGRITLRILNRLLREEPSYER
jgi:hypothetical protein